MTFEEWRTEVKIAFQGGEPTTAALMRVVTDGARAITVRDIEGDLPLAKSYRDSYRDGKASIAGTRITDDLSTVTAFVKTLMPIDNDTAAAAAIVENAIASIYNDVNGVADRWDALLVEAAIEMQRHVPFFQVRQITSYLEDSEGVTIEGFVNRIPLPETARIQQIWYGHYYPALEADVELAVDDIVVSNGRAYKVVTGGTLTVYEVAVGLTSTDGEDEDLGDLVFTYYVPERDFPVRPIDWNERNIIFAGDFSCGPLYALPPQRDEIWLFPTLNGENRFDLEWVGVTEVFEDTDEVTFDRKAASCAAHFIRSALMREITMDLRGSGSEFALFQRDLRGLVVDNEQREQGMPVSVAPYDWRRRSWCCGTCCGIVTEDSNNMTCPDPNASFEYTNLSGDQTLTATAANQDFEVTLGGVARTSNFLLNVNGASAGWRMLVQMVVPAVADIIIAFRNGTLAGDLLLPAINFTDQFWTTPGTAFTATFEFAFRNGAWEYVRSNIPS